MLGKNVDLGVVVEHINSVIKEKTIQLTDHLINKATLENKLKDFQEVPEEAKEKYEAILKSLAGKNQTQHQKVVSKLETTERINLTDYISHKNDVGNLEFAERGIDEHEKFLESVVKLRDNIMAEHSANSTGAIPVNFIK